MMGLIDRWHRLEEADAANQGLKSLVYSSLLYRTYIGSIHGLRCLYIEIPKSLGNRFEDVPSYEGLAITVTETSYEQDGCTSLILTSGSVEKNDEFAVIADDILASLQGISEAGVYVYSISRKIKDWAAFFKRRKMNILSRSEVIGLFGELLFIQNQFNAGIKEADIWWNGPKKAAQDFQTQKLAVEIKTTTANEITAVHISGIGQLSLDEKFTDGELYLLVYRLVSDNLHGTSLPELIRQIDDQIPEKRRAVFRAKLKCMGFYEEQSDKYTEKYSSAECRAYRVQDGFPRLTRHIVPDAVLKVEYTLNLNECKTYLTDFNSVIDSIKGQCYGTNKGT